MKVKFFVSAALFILLLASRAAAQSAFIPFGSESYHLLQRYEILNGRIHNSLHLSSSPVSRSTAILFLDSAKGKINFSKVDEKNFEFLQTDNDEWGNCDCSQSRKPFLKYFYRNKADLYQYRSDDFMIKLNPVLQFKWGKESASDELLFTNTRGLELRGWVAKKVGFYFLVKENQARYPVFVRERIDSFGAVPFEGYYKEFKTTAVDYFSTRGYVDFTAAKFITIQFGTDKNFLGNGFRSLALSDASQNYFFLKLQTQVWKLQYQNLYLDLTSDFLRGAVKLLPKKYAALHHLSVNVTSFLNVGLWESVVFSRPDVFEFQYLNPIIFYRSIEQMLGSPDNTLLGIDYKLNFLKRFSFYGQVMLDDYNFGVSKGQKGYWGNKFGLQNGIRYINVFGIRQFDLQAEWNFIRPYSYTHIDTVSNYTHYNQPLANPMGAGLNEWIAIIRYQPVFPLQIEIKFLSSTSSADTDSSHWGSNIFIPTTVNNIPNEFGNKVGQGEEVNLLLADLSVSYMLRHNLFIDLTFIYRKTTAELPVFESDNSILQAGVRLNVQKKSFDF